MEVTCSLDTKKLAVMLGLVYLMEQLQYIQQISMKQADKSERSTACGENLSYREPDRFAPYEQLEAQELRSIFKEYIFLQKLSESEGSVVWRGKFQKDKEQCAIKITRHYEQFNRFKIHQESEINFILYNHMQSIILTRQVLFKAGFVLRQMELMPSTLAQSFSLYTQNHTLKYQQDHLQWVKSSLRLIIDGVEAIHQAGYVHRDLKPQNILTRGSATLKIGDFGYIIKCGTVDQSLCGTLDYISPERLCSTYRKKNPVERSIDIWSIGIITFQLLTGYTPYSGQTATEVRDEIYEGYLPIETGMPLLSIKFIKSILQTNSSKRPSLQAIKKHPFLAN